MRHVDIRWKSWNPPKAGFETEEIREGSGNANGAGAITAKRDRAETKRQGCCRAAGRASRRLRQVVRIGRHAMHGTSCDDFAPGLRSCSLRQKDGTRPAQTRNAGCVLA